MEKKKPIISIIAAIDLANGIGKNGKLPWPNLPKDMAYFKKITHGKPVNMGRKNYESIPEKFRPLPNRKNIIITRQKDLFYHPDVLIVNSVEAAIEESLRIETDEVFIIGGGEIYKQTIGLADRMYINIINGKFDADVFFPYIHDNEWKIIFEETDLADEKNLYDIRKIIFERRFPRE